jgi:hypothetical protein
MALPPLGDFAADPLQIEESGRLSVNLWLQKRASSLALQTVGKV